MRMYMLTRSSAAVSLHSAHGSDFSAKTSSQGQKHKAGPCHLTRQHMGPGSHTQLHVNISLDCAGRGALSHKGKEQNIPVDTVN